MTTMEVDGKTTVTTWDNKTLTTTWKRNSETRTTTWDVHGETIEMTHFVPCRAAMYEDDHTVTLQIELRDGRAVVINAWKDGYRSVSLWWASGEHDLINSNDDRGESSKSFREWCELAVGKRPSPYPEVERKADVDTTPRRCCR